MKKCSLLIGLLFVSSFSYGACQSGTALTIDDFKYMDKADLVKYYCLSKSSKKVYTNLAHDMRNTMPEMASSYGEAAENCAVELKRISLVLKRDHRIIDSKLEEMSSIMDGELTGDNVQRCEAVI